MRGFDRDLIRGGHYGQRSCEPRKQAEHMAAPTNAANVQKALANSEPSTHGTSLPFAVAHLTAASEPEADVEGTSPKLVLLTPMYGPAARRKRLRRAGGERSCIN